MTLIEATVAIVVLTIGVTAVAAVFAGRDDQNLTWSQILNVNGGSGADGGVFLDGPQDIKDPGPDGLVNTADDGAVEYIVQPGPDGVYGTPDDVQVPLVKFQREIRIRNIVGNPNLRTLTVLITNRQTGAVIYQIQTYISAFV
jgi:hypothetical protein